MAALHCGHPSIGDPLPMSSFWLITTYFNPLGWRSRRENYDIFRRHLDARLLTVSWSPDGDHELEVSDPDLLIRVDGGDLMWQKERLINIGLSHLPDDCNLVGWVDCDILSQDPLWQQQAIALRTAACEESMATDLARITALIAASEAGHAEYLRGIA